jgi:hypothetical protein
MGRLKYEAGHFHVNSVVMFIAMLKQTYEEEAGT